MMKRWTSLLLALCLLVGLLPAMALRSDAAIYSGSCGTNVKWRLDTDAGVLSISGNGAMANYSSSSDVPWCYDRLSIMAVAIENGVTSIGGYAFFGCDSLTSVRIPDSVTSIGDYAFYSCDLTSVRIPDSVTSIGDYAFSGCDLTSVTIPDSVTSIGSYAFSECSSLTSVTIPDSVTSIGEGAFWWCDSLTSVTIPDSVTSIGSSAFQSCASLTSVTIPDSVTSIGYCAFEDCTSLTSVTIPDSVTSIGIFAFTNCSSLRRVYITDIAAWCNIKFSVDSNPLNNRADLYLNGNMVEELVLPNSVTSIGDYAFSYCDSLTSVTIPNSVTSIGDSAFRGCFRLTSVTIPDSVTSIGDWAFYSCDSLTSVTIPGSVTSIADYAFYHCDSLRHVHFLGNMPTIGSSAFNSCASDLKLCYIEGAEGWESCGYATELWDHTRTEDRTSVTYTCNDCGESYVEQIPDASHSYGTPVDNGDGTHTAICACGDAITEPHSFVEGACACGAAEVVEPTLDTNISIGESLSLESDLTMNLRIRTTQLAAYDLSTVRLVVERDVYNSDGTVEVETRTLTDYTIKDNRLVFAYTGISAAQMNDEIRAVLYIKDANGKEYKSNQKVTSVAIYSDLMLGASAGNEKLITLIMDMLNYGTAAQIYFNRHADAPVNEAFESFKTYASYASSDLSSALQDLSGSFSNGNSTATISQTLDLGTRVGITYKVTLPAGVSAENAELDIVIGRETTTVKLSDATVDSKGRYVVTFFGSTSRDMRKVVQATVYVGSKAISDTYTYTISSYAHTIANTAGMPEALVDLTRLMVIYGDSADAYFA